MKKIALFAFILFIIGIVGTITFSKDVFSMGPKGEIDQVKNMDSTGISNVIVDMDVGQINIFPTQEENITINLSGNVSQQARKNLDFDVSEQGEALLVTVNQTEDFSFSVASWFNFGGGNLELDIALPAKQWETIDVNSDVGKMNIKQLNVNQFSIESNVGDIFVDSVASKQSSIVSNVGEVKVTNGSGAYTIETDTGDIELNMSKISDQVNLKTDVGTAEVTFNQQPENLVLDLESDVGDVSVRNIEGINNSSGKSLKVQIGQGGPTLSIQTDVGDIDVAQQ